MKAKSRKSFLLLTLLLGGNLTFSTPAQAGSIIRSTKDCLPLGLIVKSSDISVQGQFCRGDRLTLDAKTSITCKQKPSLRWLNPGEYDADQICPSLPNFSTKCILKPSCYRNRHFSKIKLIGNTFSTIPNTLTLKWHRVEGAKGYEITVQPFTGETKQFTVQKPRLEFEIPLNYGEFLEINIHVLGSDEISGEFAYHVLSKSELETLDEAIAVIKAQDFSEVDRAFYLDSLYSSNGLLNEAIAALEASQRRESSLILQRRLAHRYLEAGYFDSARQMFEVIAKVSNEGSPERLEADTYLQSQLPTNINPPQ